MTFVVKNVHQSAETETVVECEGLHKWFNVRRGERLHVLQDVSFGVWRGEVLVVIGPSGSGKSTLLRCVNLLSPPEVGKVRLFGREWPSRSHRGTTHERLSVVARHREARELRELRSRVGMVFQHFNLFPHMTALGNVMFALRHVSGMNKAEARHRALTELGKVGLEERAHAYPSQLSGGQKQRVALARALACDPEVMLFDEVTSALDPELIGDVLGQMRRLAEEGMTMIVVTHEMSFAREVGDRIIYMDRGRILEEGTANEVLSSPQHPRTQAFLRSILKPL